MDEEQKVDIHNTYSEPATSPDELKALKADIATIKAKLNRPTAANNNHPSADNDAGTEQKAFADYLRSGEVDHMALTVANDAAGYVLAPEETSSKTVPQPCRVLAGSRHRPRSFDRLAHRHPAAERPGGDHPEKWPRLRRDFASEEVSWCRTGDGREDAAVGDRDRRGPQGEIAGVPERALWQVGALLMESPGRSTTAWSSPIANGNPLVPKEASAGYLGTGTGAGRTRAARQQGLAVLREPPDIGEDRHPESQVLGFPADHTQPNTSPKSFSDEAKCWAWQTPCWRRSIRFPRPFDCSG